MSSGINAYSQPPGKAPNRRMDRVVSASLDALGTMLDAVEAFNDVPGPPEPVQSIFAGTGLGDPAEDPGEDLADIFAGMHLPAESPREQLRRMHVASLSPTWLPIPQQDAWMASARFAMIVDFMERQQDLERLEAAQLQEAIDASLLMNDYVPEPADREMVSKLRVKRLGGPEMCVICQEEMEAGAEYLELGCEHVFHRACALRWFESGSTCPICKSHPLA